MAFLGAYDGAFSGAYSGAFSEAYGGAFGGPYSNGVFSGSHSGAYSGSYDGGYSQTYSQTYNRPDYQYNPDYTRVTRVTRNLFLTNKTGAGCAGDGVDDVLHGLHIDCVICVAEAHEIHRPRYPYCDFIRVPVPKDPSGPNIIRYFDEVADAIDRVERSGGRTLVLSLNGVSRGPTLVLAYLLKYKDMLLSEAFGLLVKQRPVIKPYCGFWKQLIRYEKELFGRNSVSI